MHGTSVLRQRAQTGPVARQEEVTSIKGGNLFISDISVPYEDVAPGGTAIVKVTVSNGALQIAPWDDDLCTPPDGAGGYETILHADPEWASGDIEQFCIGIADIGARDLTFEFPFQVPDTGDNYNIEFWLELPNTGTMSGTATRTVVVEEGGEESAVANGDEDDKENGNGNGNGNGPILPCILDPNQECETVETVGYAAIVVLLLFVVLSAR